MRPPIDGWFSPEFGPLADAFRENFERHGELGATVAVYVGGEEKAVLWGGYADAKRTNLWRRDTLIAPASSMKGLYSLSLHKLASDGLISYDDRVSRHWPQFAQAGKEAMTVRQLLGQTGGLQKTFPINVYERPLADVLPVMEAASPATTPGTHGAYHSQTLMPLFAGLLYKVTGEEISTWFARNIAGPWAIDAHIALQPSEFRRAGETFIEKGSYYHKLTTTLWGQSDKVNEDIIQAPSSRYLTVYTNARALARVFGGVANGGVLDGIRLFSPEVARACGEAQWSNETWYPFDNATYAGVTAVGSLGFFRACKAFPMGPDPDAWGSPGAGGNLALAEPKRGLGFAYTLNRWHSGSDTGPRVKALVEALFKCV